MSYYTEVVNNKELKRFMGYQKINLDSVSFKDPYHIPSTSHTFAEVVLIDKSPPTVQPVLYQLKIEHLNDDEIICLGHEDFIYVGEIQSINKARKQIILTNQNMVTYHHLIVSASPNPATEAMNQDEQFHAGLQALIEALKMRKQIPNTLNGKSMVNQDAARLLGLTQFASNPSKVPNKISKSNPPDGVPNPHQLPFVQEIGSIDLGTSTRRVYLVEMG